MFWLNVAVHHKSLPILRHVVGKNVSRGYWSAPANLEQRHGRSGGKSIFTVDWNSIQYAFRSYVENLFAVSSPAWLGSAISRHLRRITSTTLWCAPKFLLAASRPGHGPSSKLRLAAEYQGFELLFSDGLAEFREAKERNEHDEHHDSHQEFAF